VCAELESFLTSSGEGDIASDAPPSDLLARVRDVRARWQRMTADHSIDPDHARALDERFTSALSRVICRSASVFAGTEFDAEANRQTMESLVKRIEGLAASVTAPPGAEDVTGSLSPPTRLAAMLKEALAANTIGGKPDDNGHKRAAADDVRQAQAAWARVGFVPEDVRRGLTERFRRACRQIVERVDDGAGRSGDRRAPGGSRGREPGQSATRRLAEAGDAG
jgi:hypothetical protein